MRYLFTGSSSEEFPTVFTAEGVVLVAQPGETYELREAVTHARLEPVDRAAQVPDEPTSNQEA